MPGKRAAMAVMAMSPAVVVATVAVESTGNRARQLYAYIFVGGCLPLSVRGFF